jgi:hypothetical protein
MYKAVSFELIKIINRKGIKNDKSRIKCHGKLRVIKAHLKRIQTGRRPGVCYTKSFFSTLQSSETIVYPFLNQSGNNPLAENLVTVILY